MEQGSYCGSRGAGGVSSLTLHILAMAFMLCDHIWATLVAGQDWLTCVGRLASPIFAFLLVEGFFHTRDLRRYVLRLLLLALLSEIPFDLMYAGTPFFPFHQNVIWTFLIALFCMWVIERAKGRGSLWLTALAAAGMSLAGWLAGTIAMVDYYGAGVLTVLVFYLFRGGRWWQRLGQAARDALDQLRAAGGPDAPGPCTGGDCGISPAGLCPSGAGSHLALPGPPGVPQPLGTDGLLSVLSGPYPGAGGAGALPAVRI